MRRHVPLLVLAMTILLRPAAGELWFCTVTRAMPLTRISTPVGYFPSAEACLSVGRNFGQPGAHAPVQPREIPRGERAWTSVVPMPWPYASYPMTVECVRVR